MALNGSRPENGIAVRFSVCVGDEFEPLNKLAAYWEYVERGLGNLVLAGELVGNERPHVFLEGGFGGVEEHEVVLDDSSGSVSAAFGVIETNRSQRRIRARERCFVCGQRVGKASVSKERETPVPASGRPDKSHARLLTKTPCSSA